MTRFGRVRSNYVEIISALWTNPGRGAIHLELEVRAVSRWPSRVQGSSTQ